MSLNRQQWISLKKVIETYLPEEEKHFDELENPDEHIFHDFKNLEKVMQNCCVFQNLEYSEADDVWPYEIWECVICKKQYSVELIRDFDGKRRCI